MNIYVLCPTAQIGTQCLGDALILSLLSPHHKRISRLFSSSKGFSRFLLITFALILTLAIYFGLTSFFKYVGKGAVLGPIIGPFIGNLILSKLLEMLFLSLFFMLIFSSIISALSYLFLDDDLSILFPSPVSTSKIFWSKFILYSIDSSWMAMLFFTPVLFAFATAMKAQGYIYFIFFSIVLLFILLPNLLSGLITIILSYFFPVKQMRKVFQFLSACALTGLVFFIRSLEAEKLLNPNHFENISDYLLSIQLPLNVYTPTIWLHKCSLNLFNNNLPDALSSIIPLVVTLVVGFIIMDLLVRALYFKAWQKSAESLDNQIFSLEWIRRLMIWPFKFVKDDVRVIASKEITMFFRDPAIFSQLFMILAIVIIYGYNLSIIPLKDIPALYSKSTNNALVFLNGPFIGFILAAIGLRFVYPSISIEGQAFWAIKSAPINLRRVLNIKLFLYLIPMLGLGLTLCYISNSMFEVSHASIEWLSYINVVLITFVTTILAISVGSIFANFNLNSSLKVSGSLGGFIYMLLCGFYIFNLILLELYPIYRYNLKDYQLVRSYGSGLFFWLSIFLILANTFYWIYIPYKKGLSCIDKFEPE